MSGGTRDRDCLQQRTTHDRNLLCRQLRVDRKAHDARRDTFRHWKRTWWQSEVRVRRLTMKRNRVVDAGADPAVVQLLPDLVALEDPYHEEVPHGLGLRMHGRKRDVAVRQKIHVALRHAAPGGI